MHTIEQKVTMNRTMGLLLLAAAAMTTEGCGEQMAPPPQSPAEYRRTPQSGRNGYPRRTVLLANLQRVMDPSLATDERVESCRLVLELGASDPSVQRRLSTLLADPDTPRDLHRAVLTVLLEHNYPDLAAYAVPALYRSDQDPELRKALLAWLTHNPSPQVLGEVVKLWAGEPTATGPEEPRYRQIVELISGRKWDEALLARINSPATFPRGPALELLTARLPASALKQRVMRQPPASEAMAALQSFLESFDYLPDDRAEFAAVSALFKSRLEMISDASRLAAQWRRDHGYRFNVRDFHLLSRLARDPLRTQSSVAQLVIGLGRSLAGRQHVAYAARQDQRATVNTDQFGLQAEMLTAADLWNLSLLDEMLSRPRMQAALKIIADRNRADARSARSGLVFYQHGQAEAMLYPPPESPAADGRPSATSDRMIRDGRDALARFYVHFDRAFNTAQVGPSEPQMRDAREGSYYGIVLTSVSENVFAAHYYNPRGQVVSLGKFTFGP